MVRNVLKNKEKSLKLTTLGFTLIELLSVIVILAIIALIATPIILGIIKDAKENANKRSAENYIDAVEQAIARKNLNEGFNPSLCRIATREVTCDGKELEVEIDGEVSEDGTIVFNDGKATNGTNFAMGGTPYLMLNNEIKTDTTKESEHIVDGNIIAATASLTGYVPIIEEGNIKPGSEFKIKVSEEIGELTFFVLSNSEDGKHVNLIAQQNITLIGLFTSEPQAGDEWYATTQNNRYGPQTAYNYLNTATSNWTNIPIIESFTYLDEGRTSWGYKGIKTELKTGKHITTLTPGSSSYGNPVTYENMRARLPYVREITENTSCSTSEYGSCPLWMVNYLCSSSFYLTADNKVNSTGTNYGYWTLSSYKNNSFNALGVYNHGTISITSTDHAYNGIRPVITVLKSDLLKVMQ